MFLNNFIEKYVEEEVRSSNKKEKSLPVPHYLNICGENFVKNYLEESFDENENRWGRWRRYTPEVMPILSYLNNVHTIYTNHTTLKK